MNNCVIQDFYIRDNFIGIEGAHVILQSAVNNESCQAYIWIDDKYSIDSKVRTLMNIMENRRRGMKTNVVGYVV